MHGTKLKHGAGRHEFECRSQQAVLNDCLRRLPESQ